MTLNEKFAGKQSLLSFIKILEEEARNMVTKLEDIRSGNIVNRNNSNDLGAEFDNGRVIIVPDFYYTFDPDTEYKK